MSTRWQPPVLLLLICTCANTMMYDVISPLLVSQCQKGCAVWSKVDPKYNAWWSAGAPPSDAANHCAQLANAPGLNKGGLNPQGVGGQGAWCICEGGSKEEWAYCKRCCVAQRLWMSVCSVRVPPP